MHPEKQLPGHELSHRDSGVLAKLQNPDESTGSIHIGSFTSILELWIT